VPSNKRIVNLYKGILCVERATPLTRDRRNASAAKAAQLAKKLPDRAAIKVTVRVAIEDIHVANLLFRICLARTRWIVTDL